MSKYDPAKLAVSTNYDPGTLGVGRLGLMRLGSAAPSTGALDIAALSVTGGYETGDLGELSVDPTAASGTISQRGAGPVSVDAAPLEVGSFIEVAYDGRVLFSGIVGSASADIEAEPEPPYEWVRHVSWTGLSTEAMLLGTTVTWNSLPAEGALRRLQRWFTVDITAIDAPRQAVLYEPMGAQGAGSATLLEILRAFTARTLLPIATGVPATRVRILDAPYAWDGQEPTPVPGTENALQWSTSAKFDDLPRVASLLLSGPTFPDEYPAEGEPDSRTPDYNPDPDWDRSEPDMPLGDENPWTDAPTPPADPGDVHTFTTTDIILPFDDQYTATTDLDTPGDSGGSHTHDLPYTYLNVRSVKATGAGGAITSGEDVGTVRVYNLDGFQLQSLVRSRARSNANAAGIPGTITNDPTRFFFDFTVTGLRVVQATPYGASGEVNSVSGFYADAGHVLYQGSAPIVWPDFPWIEATSLGGGDPVAQWTGAEFAAWTAEYDAASGAAQLALRRSYDLTVPSNPIVALTMKVATEAPMPGPSKLTDYFADLDLELQPTCEVRWWVV